MSSMLSGMMGGGGGMGAGLLNGGGAMGALSNMGQVAGQINRTQAAAQGGGSIMSSGAPGETNDPESNNLRSLLDKYFAKSKQATAVDYSTSPKGMPAGMNTPEQM